MFAPAPLPYDIREWRRRPWPERVRWVCEAWALQGYGAPLPIYVFYALKMALFVGAWLFFCSFTPGLGDPAEFWYAEPIALQKAILWSMAFEGLGLGGGSGPLTGRYLPPVGGFLYFLRPGTTKAPLVPGLPIVGGHRRTLLDVLAYAAHYVLLARMLVAPEITAELVWPSAILLPLLGVTDRTLFLSARADHYYTAMLTFMFPGEWLGACKWVWAGVWLWAATSKLNRHFPSVVAVMVSNSPVLRSRRLRTAMYRSFPGDLRPSRLAVAAAHGGTAIELTFPFLLLCGSGSGDTLTLVGLATMLAFHVFITSNIPMGVPLEWNVMMVYGGLVLFGAHAGVSAALEAPALIAVLAVCLGVVPLLGNLLPARVSFLCSMRYYAGNWPYSVWLFRGSAVDRVDERLTKAAASGKKQLLRLYDADTAEGILSKVVAFRCMHLQGRALQLLVPRAVDDVDAYEWMDGELVAGVVLGWNFGDGHLHDLSLLRAVQAQCAFAEGELRCIFVESQPMGGREMAWQIADAATGLIATGKIDVDTLVGLQPWPAQEPRCDRTITYSPSPVDYT